MAKKWFDAREDVLKHNQKQPIPTHNSQSDADAQRSAKSPRTRSPQPGEVPHRAPRRASKEKT